MATAFVIGVMAGVMAPIDPVTGLPDPNRDCQPPHMADILGEDKPKLFPTP